MEGLVHAADVSGRVGSARESEEKPDKREVGEDCEVEFDKQGCIFRLGRWFRLVRRKRNEEGGTNVGAPEEGFGFCD